MSIVPAENTLAVNSTAKKPPPARKHAGFSRFGRVLLGLAGLFVLTLLWWVGTNVLPAPGSFIRSFSPTSALVSAGDLLVSSDLPIHVYVSLKRVLVGLSLALLIGVPTGLAVGSLGWLEAATTPAFQFLRMISPLSWMPIAVMVFGEGDHPIYFLLTFAAVWPILLATSAGVNQLDS